MAKTILTLTLILGGVIYYSYNHDRITLDGIQGEILMVVFKPETHYAEQYTHKSFAKVRKGMTEHEVMKLLGKPICRWRPYRFTNFKNKAHFVGFQYSESLSDTHYRLRQVYFENGKVAEVIAYYYID